MLEGRLYPGEVEAGCDEAGRGCLAGPVFAAAVVLPEGFSHPWLRDSKQMTARRRYALREYIEREALAWRVESVPAGDIDRINILNASFLAMTRAVERLEVFPTLLLIDGNRFRTSLNIPYECIVKGDAKVASIAAASVLAKTYRDDCMEALDREYPRYGWARNKGYPTREHREALRRYGPTPYHRLTFGEYGDQALLF